MLGCSMRHVCLKINLKWFSRLSGVEWRYESSPGVVPCVFRIIVSSFQVAGDRFFWGSCTAKWPDMRGGDSKSQFSADTGYSPLALALVVRSDLILSFPIWSELNSVFVDLDFRFQARLGIPSFLRTFFVTFLRLEHRRCHLRTRVILRGCEFSRCWQVKMLLGLASIRVCALGSSFLTLSWVCEISLKRNWTGVHLGFSFWNSAGSSTRKLLRVADIASGGYYFQFLIKETVFIIIW